MVNKNDEMRIRMVRRTDRHGDEYYLAITSMPVTLDLSKTVFLLFPDADGGADLVVKTHEKGVGRGEDEDMEAVGETTPEQPTE